MDSNSILLLHFSCAYPGHKSEQFIKTVSQAAIRKTQAEQSGGVSPQRQKTPTVER